MKIKHDDSGVSYFEYRTQPQSKKEYLDRRHTCLMKYMKHWAEIEGKDEDDVRVDGAGADTRDRKVADFDDSIRYNPLQEEPFTIMVEGFG